MRTLLFLCLLISGNCLSQQIEMLVEAEGRLLQGDTTNSTLLFKEVLKRYPDSYVASLRLSEINYQRAIYNEAIQFANVSEDILLRKLDSLRVGESPTGDDFLRLETFHSDKSDLYMLKGKIRMKQVRFEDAYREFEKALDNAPLPSLVHQNLGVALIQQGKTEEAVQEFQLAVTLDPANTAALMNLGTIYFRKEEYVSASFFYIRALEIDPWEIDAYNYLGSMATIRGDYDEAQAYYTGYLEKVKSEEIYFKRAVIKAELRDWESSIDDWDQVLLMNVQNNEAYRNRGLCYFQLQDYSTAIQDFNMAISLSNEPYTYINRGYCYYLVDEPKMALEDLNYGLTKIPDYAMGYYFRSLTYRRLKKKKQACADLETAINLGMSETEIDKDLLGACR